MAAGGKLGRKARPQARRQARAPAKTRDAGPRQQLREARAQQAATARILKVIARSPADVQPVFDAIVQSAVRLLGGYSATVTRIVGEQLHLAAYTSTSKAGDAALKSGYPRPLTGEGAIANAARTRAPTYISDTETAPNARRDRARAIGYRSVVVAPMLRGGRAIGTIQVTRREPGPFTAHQLNLLKTFAAQAVIAIENVQRFHENKESLERQTATAEVLRIMAKSPATVQPVLDALARRVAILCGAPNASVWLVDGDLLRRAAHYWSTTKDPEDVTDSTPIARTSVIGRTVLERRIIHVANTTARLRKEFPGAAKRVQRGHIRAALCVPLLREGEAIGVIVLWKREAGLFADAQVELLRIFADQAVIAISNVSLFNETKEALERQTATADILKVIANSPTNVQPVLDAVARRAALLCGVPNATVWLVEGDVLRTAATYWKETPAEGQDWHDATIPVRKTTVSGRAVLERRMIHIEDIVPLLETEYPEGHARIRQTAIRAALVVPMIREGKAFGTLSLWRLEPGLFSQAQTALLQTFADQAVIAIENVRLFNETKEALERQTATADILRAISRSQTDVQPVFDTILSNALQLCEAMIGTVFRVKDDMMRVAATVGPPAYIDRIRHTYPLRIDDPKSVVGVAMMERRAFHIPDLGADDRFERAREFGRIGGYRSVLFVPMVRNDVSIGCIGIGRPTPFSEANIDLLKTFADQAVIAIENVRLFNETKEALERQTATAEILEVIASSPSDVQPVFDAIARSALRLVGGLASNVTRVVDNMQHLAAFTSRGEIGDEALRSLFPREIDGGLNSGRAIIARAPAYRVDTETDPDISPEGREAARAGGFRSVLSVPMLRDGIATGAISVSRRESGPFSEHHIRLLQTFADQAVIAIENVRLFNETKEALERQTATAEILKVISRSPTDVQPVFDAIAASALRLLGGLGAAVTQLVGDMVHLSAHTATDQAGIDAMKSFYPRPLSSMKVTERVVRSGRPEFRSDYETDPAASPESRELARARGFRSNLWVPLVRDGVGFGTINVTRAEAGPFSDHQIELLETFADQAVIAIENVRLFNETKEALERQTATAEILKVISGSPTDTQPVFDTIVRNFVALSGGAFGAVFRYEGGLVHYAGSAGFTSQQRESVRTKYPVRADDPSVLSSRVIIAKTPIHIHDVREDQQYDLGHAATAGWRRMLAVPMLRDGEPLGSIVAAWTEAGATPRHHEDLLKTFADQAVIAIENVRLFKELQSRTEALTRSVGQLTALGEVGQAISSTLELETVLQTIVQRAVQLTGLDGGVIYEYDEVKEEFRLQAATYFEAELLDTIRREPIRKGDGTVGGTAVTLEPAQVKDIFDAGYQSSRKELLIRAGYRAVLTVPLLREDHVIGALSVTRRTPGPFAPEVVELMKTFATQSAMAIQNARLFREIAEKGRQLEEASQHKSNFLASMSHELRTPLNAILGLNEMLLGQIYGEVPADMQAPLAQIQTSGKHLLRLINNVLDLAKIEAGRMELSLSDYSVQDTVASVQSTLSPLAAEKGLEFLANAPNDIPLAYGDGGRITQCLMNLAGNSLKFTKAGRVEISVAEQDGLLTYRVADTGIGIPPDKIGSLFTEFKQTDATIASEYGGTGLGLSISRKFVEMHGGRIWVESEPGKGSAFIFEIPLRAGTS